MINILIADQSYIVCSGFTVLLEQFKEINKVKNIYSAEECVTIINDFEPDVILINTSFLNEIDKNLIDAYLKKGIKLLYIFNSFLPKDAALNQISLQYCKADIIDRIQEVVNSVKSKELVENDTQDLSPREKSILKCVALGLTNKEIGEKEFISTHTVISHRKNITRKLGIKTVSGLTVYAIINNIIHMNDIN